MGANAIPIFGGIICFLGIVLLSVVYYFWKFHSGSATDYPTSVRSHPDTGADKREHPRADINWAASMETSDGRIDAQIKNISLGGAFICCKKPLSIGEVFPLTMLGPDNEPVMATAKVVWSNVNVPDEKVVNRGMGVRFLKMSDRHIQLVRQIFQENNQSAAAR
jgi:Tfp pilus assembly protein PilZ